MIDDVELLRQTAIEFKAKSHDEFELYGLTDRVCRYNDLPYRYPKLPNFGVLYLSVPRAASLIRDHVYKTELHFEIPIENIQAHIMQEIAAGHLASTLLIEMEFFFEPQIKPRPERTYIFYGDLLKWLETRGYTKREILDSKVFGEYEDLEIALAKQIDHLVLSRRELLGYSVEELKPFQRDELPWDVTNDDEPDPDRILLPVISENRELKRQLAQTPAPTPKPLHPREAESILIVLAALLAARGYDDVTPGLVKDVAKEAEGLCETISINTIRTMLKKAIGLIKRTK